MRTLKYLVPILLASVAAAGCVKKKGGAADEATSGAAAGIPAGGNLIKNADFESGGSLPWTLSFTPPAKGKAYVKDGWYCLDTEHKGSSPWDAQVRHREMTLVKGHTYNISFKIKADKPNRLRTKVGMIGPPYTEYWVQTHEIGPEPKTVTGSFTMRGADDNTVEWAFHIGGNMSRLDAPFTFCIDDVYLTDPQFTPPPPPPPPPSFAVRVNQVGYMPGFAKRAVAVSASPAPQQWQLLDAAGGTVASGQTTVFGMDKDSGDNLHQIDFSSVKKTGQGFKLKVGNDESPAFDIRTDLYAKVKYDALAYFYHNRSGIEIKKKYVKEDYWARPAGHMSDKSVPCAPGTCSYTLDVTGGWYDAGDHGKYVVNGGIALWTMQNQYERAKFLGSKDTLASFGDGKLAIPEAGNGKPDLLDEARWEVEFMLKMQVPEGDEMAGMVHHKIHDENWTALGLRPPVDTAEIKMKRYLRPISTAATLNMAATVAQAARLWRELDPEFSRKCLEAAERAWTAALAHPDKFAPKSDTLGGGPYDDTDVSDEFYWAAAELYITTSKFDYQEYLTKSPHYLKIPQAASGDGGGVPSAMTWQLTTALGTISIATVPNGLGAKAVKEARANVVSTADMYLGLIEKQGYRSPFQAMGEGYPWGSNSFILNNMMVMGLAYDFSKKAKFVDGVLDGANYIYGNNAMGQSYVTGYGSKPLLHPHHRFWSNQADARFPKAPPGCVSGGPNSGLQDPYVQAAGLTGCAPQKCFVDNIEAWSANEITINWNTPFAWSMAFLNEVAK